MAMYNLNMFPLSFKEVVFTAVKSDIKYLAEKHPDLKNRLDIELELFSIDEDLLKNQDYSKFLSSYKVLILQKYKLLLFPRIQISGSNEDDTGAILNFFINDFYVYAVYKCAESANVDKVFDEIWTFFETEFFAPSNKIMLKARVKNLYYQSGFNAENIIPWQDVKLTWAKEALDFRTLGWERKGNFYTFIDYFQAPWIILQKEVAIHNNTEFNLSIIEAENQFNLFMFVLRNTCKGDAYFNDIRIFGLGHFSPLATFGVSWKPIVDNDIYEEFGEHTTLTHPWDWSISKLLKKCNSSAYKEYVFADWQIRLNSQLKIGDTIYQSETRNQFYLFEKILNLSFVFNSLLPDIKNKKGYADHRANKELREDYLPEVLKNYLSMDKLKTKSTIKTLYDIRNDIAHGKAQDAKAKLQMLGTMRDKETQINYFSFMISKIILISLANSDFKLKMEAYFNSKDISKMPQIVSPFS